MNSDDCRRKGYENHQRKLDDFDKKARKIYSYFSKRFINIFFVLFFPSSIMFLISCLPTGNEPTIFHMMELGNLLLMGISLGLLLVLFHNPFNFKGRDWLDGCFIGIGMIVLFSCMLVMTDNYITDLFDKEYISDSSYEEKVDHYRSKLEVRYNQRHEEEIAKAKDEELREKEEAERPKRTAEKIDELTSEVAELKAKVKKLEEQ